MTLMEEKTLTRKLLDATARWATFVTLLVTIITYSIGDHRLLAEHDSIIKAYEAHGSPQVVKMQAQTEERFKGMAEKYEERFKADEHRLDLLEQGIITISDMRVEMVKISAKMDSLHESLERHMGEKTK